MRLCLNSLRPARPVGSFPERTRRRLNDNTQRAGASRGTDSHQQQSASQLLDQLATDFNDGAPIRTTNDLARIFRDPETNRILNGNNNQQTTSSTTHILSQNQQQASMNYVSPHIQNQLDNMKHNFLSSNYFNLTFFSPLL